MKVSLFNWGKPKNYQVIDETVSRSAQPTKKNIKWLRKHGTTDVINFRTMGVAGIKFDEKQVVEKNGMVYHNVPSITKHPTEENVGNFLDIVEGVKQKGGKVHIHCKAGADRTGMYSYIYEGLNNIKTQAANTFEWFKHGYHFDIYPNILEWANNFLKNKKK